MKSHFKEKRKESSSILKVHNNRFSEVIEPTTWTTLKPNHWQNYESRFSSKLCTQGARLSMKVSLWGLNLLSCRWKSSTVPMRKTLIPGYPELLRYINEPHVAQKLLVTVYPEAIVCDCWNCLRFARPRTCFRWEFAIVKQDENIDAVILWQSLQWQRKVLINPGPWVG